MNDNNSERSIPSSYDHIPKLSRTAKAFLDAEEKLMELRLARHDRRTGPSRASAEIRRQFHERKNATSVEIEKVQQLPGNHSSKRLTRGANH